MRSGTGIVPVRSCGIGILPMIHGLEASLFYTSRDGRGMILPARPMFRRTTEPGGRKSIAQRFIAGCRGRPPNQSRQGRKNAVGRILAFFRPGRGWVGRGAFVPTVETVGYD